MRPMQPDSQTPSLAMTRDQVRAFDAWAIQDMGIPGAVLMENAGRGCASEIHDHYGDRQKLDVTIVCGTGNNGGDGFVIARHLWNRGHRVTAILCGDRARVQGDAKLNLDIWEHMGGPLRGFNPKQLDLGHSDLLVDALFGTGLSGSPRAPYSTVIEGLNQADCPRVAVDIPSGLDCNTGSPWGLSVRADLTVTFVCLKRGFLNEESRPYCGAVRVASIGIEPAQWPARPTL